MSSERGYSPSHLPVMKKTSPLHSELGFDFGRETRRGSVTFCIVQNGLHLERNCKLLAL